MFLFIYLFIIYPFLVFFRLSGTCSHVVGLVHTIAHYQNLNLKEVPDELSATSLPQQWHKPRGRKIKPQAVVSMTLANPIKSPADRKRKPIFTEVSEETVPNSTPNQILKLKEDRKTPLSYLQQENAPTIPTRLGQVQTGSPLYFHVSVKVQNTYYFYFTRIS